MLKFYESDENVIKVYDDGTVFVNGECIFEGGTDEQLGKYDSKVINGEGYYGEDGSYHAYSKE